MRFATFAFCLATLASSAQAAADPVYDYALPVRGANAYKGNLAKYYFNGLTVHTYESVEGHRDWSIVFENSGNLVLLEPQTMPDSAMELRRYLDSIEKPLAGVLVSYHGAGPDSFPGVPFYAAPETAEFFESGAAEQTLKRFAEHFHGVDPKVIVPTNPIEGKETIIGGIRFLIRPNPHSIPMPGMDVALPTHKMYYMHRLGGDTHSQLGSVTEVEPCIEYLENLKRDGYEIFLSAHHKPESIADVDAKIVYLRTLKEVFELSLTKEEFVSEMRRHAPTYRGEQYLEATGSNLYH